MTVVKVEEADMGDIPLSNVTSATTYGGTRGTDDSEKESPIVTDVPSGNTPRRRYKPTVMLSTLGSIIAASFSMYIVVLSFTTYSLFSWHPSLMTLGTFLLMGEAVMAMSQDNIITGRLGRPSRVKIHWILQAIAASLIFIGFLIIVINKNINNKHHFHTWHSIFGLITVIMVGITSSGGVAALFSVQIKQFIQPALMKLVHNVAGILTYICGALSMILAMYSTWFQKQNDNTAQIICMILIIVVAVCTLESAVGSAYGRIKQMLHRL